jgi:uncharacterized protein (TIGR03067 family)
MKPGWAILLAFGLLSTFAHGTLAADLDAEMDKLKGTWVSVSFEATGAAKNSRKLELTFNGDRVKQTVDDRVQNLNYELDVDSEPKRLTILTIMQGVVVKANAGIYKFDGDTLTICHGGKLRPEKFGLRTGPNYADSLIVLQRKR